MPGTSTSPYANSDGYGLGAQAVAYAARFLGVPYVWGGASPAGFDCSGLVQFVYQNLGVTLPRTSQEQATAGMAVSGADLQPGDLILYNEPGEGPNSHVAIYAGGGEQIDAPYAGAAVRYDPVDWTHFAGARRLGGTAAAPSTSPGGISPTATATGVSWYNPFSWGTDLTSTLKGIAITLPLVLGAVALVVVGLGRTFQPRIPAAPQAGAHPVPIPV